MSRRKKSSYESRQQAYKRKMRSMGLCQDCGMPAVPGRVRCAVHLEVEAKKARERRSRRKVQAVLPIVSP